MIEYYDMDGKPMESMIEWGQLFESEERIIGMEDRDGVLVSTVWIGIPMSLGHRGPPLIFETMIFGGPHDQERYSTREEAQAGHHDACVLAFGTTS